MTRVRRAPADARALIVAAARTELAAAGPEHVTLRRIAERARVSAGLVTHYFGSYEALVQAVLDELRTEALRRLAGTLGTDAVLEVAFDFLMDPTRRRLRAWLDARNVGADPAKRRDFVARLAEAWVAARADAAGVPPPSSAEVHAVVEVLLAAAQGRAPASDAADARFRRTLRSMFEVWVKDRLGQR